MNLRADALIAIVMLLAAPAYAAASGGKDIASAPAVVYGQQQVGNTATDSPTPTCTGDEYNSWWLLPVVAGDKVTVDWEGAAEYARAYAIGTSDFNLDNATRDKAGLQSNGKGELVFTAPATGARPLRFSNTDCDFGERVDPGPYDFTAYVKHALLLAVPRKSSLPRSGTIKVQVRNPDGAPIDDPNLSLALRVRFGSKTRIVGRAPATSGIASIAYRIPKSLTHRKVSLSAQGTGAAYLTKTSSAQRVKVR